MRYMTTWKLRSGSDYQAAVARFMEKGQEMPPGVKSIDRWHATDLSIGFHLLETDDPAALMANAATWVDLLELHVYPVVGDAEAGPVYAKSIGA